MQTTLVANKNKKSSKIPFQHQLFNRHRQKINTLTKKIEALKDECDRALAFYHSEIVPEKKELIALIIRFILEIKKIVGDQKRLTKEERRSLKKLLEDDLSLLFNLCPHHEIPDEIKKIYKEVFGEDSDETFQKAIADVQKELEQELGVEGFDLSSIHADDSAEEIFAKFAQAFGSMMGEQSDSKSKGKKELLYEKKALELEELKKVSLSGVYKRLAKELHPDLEQDPLKKSEKEKLMKQVTAEYENKNLLALLKLESEWLTQFEKNPSSLKESDIKIYNSLLKEQIDNLKEELFRVPFHPRFFEIHEHIERYLTAPLKGLRQVLSEYKSLQSAFSNRFEDLKSGDPLHVLKKALRSYDLTDLDLFEEVISQVFGITH